LLLPFQRKHEGLERDLAALEGRVEALNSEAAKLSAVHPVHAEAIAEKLEDVGNQWRQLQEKAADRKARLDESFLLQRFLADFRDLFNWVNEMKATIAADEVAKDVSGAEALLERHGEHRGEIDAREDSFQSCSDAGEELLTIGHPASDEIREKLTVLANEKRGLMSLWEERRFLYEQCIDLQLFYRDKEQADTWMAKQEAFLSNTDLGRSQGRMVGH
ncbi:unnamed protein product, partial [Cyprideis torosa]